MINFGRKFPAGGAAYENTFVGKMGKWKWKSRGKLIDSLSAYLFCNHRCVCEFCQVTGPYNRQLPVIGDPSHVRDPPFFISNQRHVKFVECKEPPKSQQINGEVSIFFGSPFISCIHVKLRLVWSSVINVYK